MIKKYLEIGQVVSTHGIRGEVRINPWCNGPEFIKKFKTLYKDAKGTQSFTVVSCRPHKNVAIAKLEGITCGFKNTSCPDQLAQALKKLSEEE